MCFQKTYYSVFGTNLKFSEIVFRFQSIADYLTSNGRKISPNTVGDYVAALTESFIFYAAERFDIVGKQLLKANRKLYIVDLGLRNHSLPRSQYDLDFAEVKGQENVKRALEVAAAGGHNLIMVGPPGSGKSMMAKRLPSILPPLSLSESL